MNKILFRLVSLLIVIAHCYGCRRDNLVEPWISPQYEKPPYPVTIYVQVGGKLVRVMESPSGRLLHVKSTDGVVLDTAIGIDEAIKKYPEIKDWLHDKESAKYVFLFGHDLTTVGPKSGPHCFPNKLAVLGSVSTRDWVVTALSNSRTLVYSVEQCGHLIATGLSEAMLTNSFPELADVPSCFDTELLQGTDSHTRAHKDGKAFHRE